VGTYRACPLYGSGVFQPKIRSLRLLVGSFRASESACAFVQNCLTFGWARFHPYAGVDQSPDDGLSVGTGSNCTVCGLFLGRHSDYFGALGPRNSSVSCVRRVYAALNFGYRSN
jgi:hypothetical protein